MLATHMAKDSPAQVFVLNSFWPVGVIVTVHQGLMLRVTMESVGQSGQFAKQELNTILCHVILSTLKFQFYIQYGEYFPFVLNEFSTSASP